MNFGQLILEFRNILKAKSSPVPLGNKILIFGHGRSGSTVLQNMLSPNDRCQDMGELLRERRNRQSANFLLKAGNVICRDFEYVDGLARHYLSKGRIQQICAHIKPENIDYDIERFLDNAKSKGWIVLLLYRNVADVQISAVTAMITGHWHTRKDSQATETYHSEGLGLVDWQNPMLEGMKKKYRGNVRMQSWGSQNSHFPCHYELDLRTLRNQSEFANRLRTCHPEVICNTSGITIRKNSKPNYSNEDLEAMNFLRREAKKMKEEKCI